MTRRRQGLVFAVAAVLYTVTSYAGIRSPDEEVVFETCDALLHRHTFAVEAQSTCAIWQGWCRTSPVSKACSPPERSSTLT